jgi:hypothetical protein
MITFMLVLVILGALGFLVVRWANKRSQARYEELAPMPPSALAIVAADSAARSNGKHPEPVAASNGNHPEPVAATNGFDPEVTELEAELKGIYDRVGKPDAFEEAKGKVTEFASDLVNRDGIDMHEALRTSYRRSLTEHHEYLASKHLA